MSPWIAEIQPLAAGHRHALQLHLLGLDPADRHARFGSTLSDAALLAWVQDIDWSQSRWWGAWSFADTGLRGALQLTPTRHAGSQELALTVDAALRRQGVATALLKQAISTRTDRSITLLACENAHPAVLRMAQTLNCGVRTHPDARRIWLELPAHTVG